MAKRRRDESELDEVETSRLLLACMLLGATPGHSTLIRNGTPDPYGPSLIMDTRIAAESFTILSTMTIKGIEFADNGFASGFDDSFNYYILRRSTTSI